MGSSVAGHVKAGESYAQAARREYAEELGLPPPQLVQVGTTWVDEKDHRKFVGVFVATETRELRPDAGEIGGLTILPLSAVAKLVRESDTVSETFKRAFRYALEHDFRERE